MHVNEWIEKVPVAGSVELPPDPRALDAIGRNHSFETALADLVDNSIDAGASNVLIRFIRMEGQLRSLYVVDNGRGMTPEQIDTAMTVGSRREYRDGDLGRFGLGLKAASFSQARNLTVMSRAAESSAVGRRWRLDEAKDSFLCDVVPEGFATREIEKNWNIPWQGHGTVVRWDDVGAFPDQRDTARVEAFITKTTIAAGNHLGLVFHRLIEAERINIAFEVKDVDSPNQTIQSRVRPLNPFGYLRTGHQDYPKDIVASTEYGQVTFRCHIWPGRSTLREFKLLGRPLDTQGLYFYRKDRLLHTGGWDGVNAPDPQLQLARVQIDIDDDVTGLFRMNPEKSRVQVGPDFARICAMARSSDGVTFDDYLHTAEQVFRTASKRDHGRKPMIHPGVGFPPKLRATIEREIPPAPNEEPIDIRWRMSANETFFEIDHEQRTVWLNKRYRKMLLGDRHGGLNDLPLLKTLIYLLMQKIFEGDRRGPRDKDNVELWQALLTAAVRAERQ